MTTTTVDTTYTVDASQRRAARVVGFRYLLLMANPHNEVGAHRPPHPGHQVEHRQGAARPFRPADHSVQNPRVEEI
jgi:hypothetical protein